MPRALKLSGWWLIVPALIAVAMLIDRPRPNQPSHQAEWLQAGDAWLRTVRAGTGDTTVLLIHGFGESLFTWRSILDPLALHYRVVAIDLPGFGGSSKPFASYAIDSMTARMSDFLDRNVAGPVIAVGHSMGGAIASSLALARPDRIVALVLIAPAGWSVGLGGIADTMYPTKARAIGWYLSSRAFVLPEHDPDWLGEPDSAARYTLMTDSAYRISAARVLEEFDFRGLRIRFGEIRQPVLLIWGTLDPVIRYPFADSVSNTLPCNNLVTLDGAFHRPQVEVPDTVLGALRPFLAAPRC